MMNHYISYYDNQIGGGGLVEHVYVGSPYQRGHGIGSFLGGLFRRALPMISSGLRAIGKEALRGGLHVVDDITNQNMNFKDSLKTRLGESTSNLQRKAKRKIDDLMAGKGYKRGNPKRPRHSLISTSTKHRVASGRVSKRSKKKTRKPKNRKNEKKKKKKKKAPTHKKKQRTVYDIFK